MNPLFVSTNDWDLSEQDGLKRIQMIPRLSNMKWRDRFRNRVCTADERLLD